MTEMNILVRAEFYRLRHSANKLSWVILSGLICASFSFLSETLSVNRVALSQSVYTGIVLFCSVIGAMIGSHFQNRTVHYEMMDGKAPQTMIASRLVCYGVLSLLCFLLPVSVLLLLFDGGMESMFTLLLIAVILLRYLVLSVCIVLIVKVDGAICLLIPRVILEVLSLQLLGAEKLATSGFANFLRWLLSVQCISLSGQLDGALVIKILVGCLVESMLLFGLKVLSLKRKWFVQTVFK